MNNALVSWINSKPISRYKDIDDLKYHVLWYAFVSTIVIIGFSIVYHLFLSEDTSKPLFIGIPMVVIASVGLFILPRLSLDTTVSITFTLMYIGVYTSGIKSFLSPGYVILILNMILIITLFFIKQRLAVLAACLIGVIANVLVIESTSIFLHEYLIGSIAFLSFFYAISTLIYKYQDRLVIENKNIQDKNHEIQLLLKEIHHRVKNNLQTISSILYLQSVKMTDLEAKEAITKGQHRIESIALIHKNLYLRNNLAGIEMKDYIASLVDNLDSAHGSDKDIDVTIEMESTELEVDTAIPLGLILNELLTNAFEYAFIDKPKGQINISMKQNIADQHVIEIQDNGVGDNSVKNKFGNKLIELLTKQINAKFIEGNHQGYWCQITIQ